MISTKLSSGSIQQSDQEDAFYNETPDLHERSQNVVPDCKTISEQWEFEKTPECQGAIAALQAKAAAQRVPHFFDNPIDVRRVLIAKRLQDGHDTPIGHTYSNIIEILDGWLEYRAQPWATHPSQTLAGKMNYQIGRLERLSGNVGGRNV